jgi:hypothetical protein
MCKIEFDVDLIIHAANFQVDFGRIRHQFGHCPDVGDGILCVSAGQSDFASFPVQVWIPLTVLKNENRVYSLLY